MSIHLRAIQTSDESFLFAVYASTREVEMRQVDWDLHQKDVFLRMQFKAQSQYYLENYPGAEFQVILVDEQPAGRFYLHRRPNEIRIMDITLLPAYRGRGIGSFLLNKILTGAARDNLPVTIHVERFNPALHLYERLGFRLLEDKGVYLLMERKPATTEQNDDAR